MSVGITDVLQRLVELEQDAVSGSVAYPGMLIIAVTYPYWTNVPTLEAVRVLATGDVEYNWRVTLQLHVNKFQAGFDGKIESQALGYLESVAAFFVTRPGLNRPDLSPLGNLSPTLTTLASGRMVQFAPAADISELICEWELRIPIRTSIGVK